MVVILVYGLILFHYVKYLLTYSNIYPIYMVRWQPIHCTENTMETDFDSLIVLVLGILVVWIFSYIRKK